MPDEATANKPVRDNEDRSHEIARPVIGAFVKTDMSRRWIFSYNILTIAALIAVAVWYASGPSTDGKSSSHAFKLFDQLFTLFPLAVRCAWFGTLGGVVISLKGVYDHSAIDTDTWKNR
jgi:hypothetical protein